ncbi:uncharacterized protein L199_005128 [Kwoniella botswanensis]|uniref:uncharacterized protein n=1 Tax=Kwoniella botswanensis TaxID=1268659 RepID=UPI00315D0173
MPDLMSLSDEIIDRIGYLLHQDNFIPFPSFNPSWANFALEINPTVASDYLAFRSTCKRIFHICGLKGLHIRLDRWGKLLKWLVYAPDQVKRGVRRMSIDITHKRGRSIISAWTTLITFLQTFPSLQELIIIDTPLCRHHDNTTSIRDLHHLTPLCFLQLSSLSFEMECRECSIHMPELVLECAPYVRHLKTIDSTQLSIVLEAMDDTHPDDTRPRFLCIKLFEDTSKLDMVLQTIGGCYPQVTHLHLSMHEVAKPHVFTPCAYISDLGSFSEVEEVKIGLVTKSEVEQILMGHQVEPDEKALMMLNRSLSRMVKLRDLDCGMMFLDRNGHRPIARPLAHETKTSYMDRQAKSDEYRQRQIHKMHATSDFFFHNVGSFLEVFSFWVSDRRGRPNCWNNWRRVRTTRSHDEDVGDFYESKWTSSHIGEIDLVESEDVSNDSETDA